MGLLSSSPELFLEIGVVGGHAGHGLIDDGELAGSEPALHVAPFPNGELGGGLGQGLGLGLGLGLGWGLGWGLES